MATPEHEDDALLREHIEAAIAAGRELEPDMDKHLVDSTLERYQKDRAARAKALGQTQQAAPPVVRPSGGEIVSDMFRMLLGFVLIGGIIFAIAFNHFWGFWWLIFFIFPLMGMLFGGRGRYRSYRYRYGGGDWASYQQSREERRQMKIRKLEDKLNRYKSGQFDDED
jgi:hypothetical protein